MRPGVAIAFIIWFAVLLHLPSWILRGVLLGALAIVVLLLLIAIGLFVGFWWDEREFK